MLLLLLLLLVVVLVLLILLLLLLLLVLLLIMVLLKLKLLLLLLLQVLPLLLPQRRLLLLVTLGRSHACQLGIDAHTHTRLLLQLAHDGLDIFGIERRRGVGGLCPQILFCVEPQLLVDNVLMRRLRRACL